jgi:hypothetical protein
MLNFTVLGADSGTAESVPETYCFGRTETLAEFIVFGAVFGTP